MKNKPNYSLVKSPNIIDRSAYVKEQDNLASLYENYEIELDDDIVMQKSMRSDQSAMSFLPSDQSKNKTVTKKKDDKTITAQNMKNSQMLD